MYKKIINVASRPFILQIDNWIYEGKLHDPNDEFFITADYHVPTENLWFKRFFFENIRKLKKKRNVFEDF